MVHDNVQKELIKEVEIEKGVFNLLTRLHEQVVEQLRLNRKAKYNLESDLKNKFGAMSIDSHVQSLGLTNPTTYLKSGAAKIEPKYLINVQIFYEKKNIFFLFILIKVHLQNNNGKITVIITLKMLNQLV